MCAGVKMACVSADAARTTGRERHVAQGLLHGLAVANEGVRRLQALSPRFWRITEGDKSESQLVRRYHASTTALLSDAWRAAAHDPLTGRTRSPWQDWPSYRSFVVDWASHASKYRLAKSVIVSG